MSNQCFASFVSFTSSLGATVQSEWWGYCQECENWRKYPKPLLLPYPLSPSSYPLPSTLLLQKFAPCPWSSGSLKNPQWGASCPHPASLQRGAETEFKTWFIVNWIICNKLLLGPTSTRTNNAQKGEKTNSSSLGKTKHFILDKWKSFAF